MMPFTQSGAAAAVVVVSSAVVVVAASVVVVTGIFCPLSVPAIWKTVSMRLKRTQSRTARGEKA
jgi:hypothetical protein